MTTIKMEVTTFEGEIRVNIIQDELIDWSEDNKRMEFVLASFYDEKALKIIKEFEKLSVKKMGKIKYYSIWEFLEKNNIKLHERKK